ncbi:glutathione S-transferase 1 [Ixodes scapularis]|nr:glutathione S-transferase 1 [Ixodes scapularis]
MPVDLYNLYGSPPCGLVRMLAKHIGVELNVKNVNLAKGENRTPEFLKMNPFHKVPTIDDDGFVLYESTAICYYLLNKYAPDSELYPKCPRGRARVDQVLATMTSTIQPPFMAFFRPRFFTQSKPTDEEVKALEENVLQGIETLVGDGNYALGDKLTLADLSLMAHLSLLAEIPVFDSGKFPKVAAYYERLKAELPYYEEINRPGISALVNLWPVLK